MARSLRIATPRWNFARLLQPMSTESHHQPSTTKSRHHCNIRQPHIPLNGSVKLSQFQSLSCILISTIPVQVSRALGTLAWKSQFVAQKHAILTDMTNNILTLAQQPHVRIALLER